MRIVYLLSNFELVGGQEYYLARQQARQGHDITVVTSDRFYPLSNIQERYTLEGFGPEYQTRKVGIEQVDGFTIIRLPTVIRYQDFYLVRGVMTTLKRLQPDVVFAHEPRTIVPCFGALGKKSLGYAYFVDVHDFFHRVQNHAWWQRWLRYAEYFWWRKWFVQYALNKADCIISVADECKKFIHERHGMPLGRIRDLPLGVETDFFRFTSDGRVRRRKELGYGEHDVVLMFSGYMFRRKALESLIDVLAAEKGRLPLKLLLVGEIADDYRRELEVRAEKTGVAPQVRFYRFASRKTMAELYSAADIGVWPGNNTLAILEAMACCLPLVIADMQLAHLAKHGNGMCVPYADVPELRKSIVTLANDPILRKTMGERSGRAIHEQYSYAILARRVTEWMEEAVTATASRRTTQPAAQEP